MRIFVHAAKTALYPSKKGASGGAGQPTRHQTPDTRHQTPDTRHQTPDTRHHYYEARSARVNYTTVEFVYFYQYFSTFCQKTTHVSQKNQKGSVCFASAPIKLSAGHRNSPKRGKNHSKWSIFPHYAGKYAQHSGNFSTYSGKSALHLGKYGAYSGKYAPYSGKCNSYLGKYAPHLSKYAPYLGTYVSCLPKYGIAGIPSIRVVRQPSGFEQYPLTTAACKTAFDTLVAQVRDIKKRYIYVPPLTPADLKSLNLEERDTTPTKSGTPTAQVENEGKKGPWGALVSALIP